MQEWLNWHAWKACVPQKGTGGSNPPLSATINCSLPPERKGFLFYSWPSHAHMSEVRCKIKIFASSARKGAVNRCREPQKGSPKAIRTRPHPLTPTPKRGRPSPGGPGEQKNCPPVKRGSQLSYSGMYSDWSQKVSLALPCHWHGKLFFP